MISKAIEELADPAFEVHTCSPASLLKRCLDVLDTNFFQSSDDRAGECIQAVMDNRFKVCMFKPPFSSCRHQQ